MFRRLSVLVSTVALTAGVLAVSTELSASASPSVFSLSPAAAPAAVAAKPKKDRKRKPAPPNPAWVPPAGGVFNNPTGEGKARLVKRVIAAVNNTPSGATIRIAAYSFDRRDVADALIRAKKRGVNVQMVLNDNWTSGQTARLRKKFGHKLKSASSVRICKKSCRGGPGNLHMKVYAFTQTGAARDVIITGSANMTDRAVNLQWNDLYTLNNVAGLHDTFVRVFEQLKRDKPVRPRRVYYNSGTLDATFYRVKPNAAVTDLPVSPRLPGPAQDPVMQRLQAISCKAAAGFGNNKGKTKIRIMMYGWNGKRGIWLAEEMAKLKKKGCDIAATLSLGGGNVVKILGAAGIPIQSMDWKYLPDGTVDFYNHLKTITISGTLNGRSTRSTWTGSENWSGMSFRNDELILQINDTATYNKYLKRFNALWASKASHSFGYKPTGRP